MKLEHIVFGVIIILFIGLKFLIGNNPTEAKKVLENGASTVEDITKAQSALSAAAASLVKKADFSKPISINAASMPGSTRLTLPL